MEAPTLRCRSCGGPVASTDLRCPYCDSQLATISCPQCFALVSLEAKHCPQCGAAIDRQGAEATLPGKCPACREPMQATQVGTTRLNQCAHCGGAWLGRECFEHLLQDRESWAPFLGESKDAHPLPPAHPLEVTYRPCPECSKLMNRTNFARVSGVIVDTCREHGIWFDRDELRAVLAFVEAGGMQKASQHEQAELQGERDRLKLERAASELPLEAPGLGTLLGSSPSRAGTGALLGEILAGAALTLFDRFRK